MRLEIFGASELSVSFFDLTAMDFYDPISFYGVAPNGTF
jgi:hypothetical protein